ncbi:MAG TPA: S41 family peptidase [Bacteroidota bacterium]|nr:S41 family peptidase [Bacteroidota bacterium]
MKKSIGFLFSVVALCFLSTPLGRAQGKALPPDNFPRRVFTPYTPAHPLSVNPAWFRIPGKKPTQYTAADWGKLIDSTWGPGQSAADQLNVFDTFWTMIDQQWAGFPNLTLNWDSLRAVYRPQIGSGLSRGRFYALMSRMWLALLEHHSWIYDAKVDTIFGVDPLFDGSAPWRYKSGVPLLIIGSGWWDLLGAPVTPMPDSSGLVYRIATGNPLGLEPGDLIVGYDGIPWKRLYGQLLDDGVPVSKMWSYPGSTPESRSHEILSAVGWNWGLFDTIDIVKYSSGDTIHLSTAPLATLSQTVWASDQLPVAGVPMPQGAAGNTPTVTWGVVEGTNIGYVYAWDWYTPGTPQLFHDAIYDLRNNKKVEGLILDFRLNWGGDPSYADGGLSQLFNFDPTTNMSFATRNSASDHFGFSISSNWLFTPAYKFTPTAYPFDRPIAVLIGPACHSAGDWTAFWMRFHPMARSFGEPTNGAFVSGSYANGTIPDTWPYQVPTSVVYSNVPGEGFFIHKGIQPDEKVWLTRDGVAKGVDDVVQRALSWITTLSYAHDVHLVRRGIDTLGITAQVENPLSHTIHVTATLTSGSGNLIDSLSLFDDGQHGDGAAGDGLWAYQYVPAKDDTLLLAIRTDDLSLKSSRTLPAVARYFFTRNAMISMDPSTLNLGTLYEASIDTSISVKNVGYASDSLYVILQNINVNPDSAITFSPTAFALAAGDSQKVTMHVRPNLLPPSFYYADIVVTSRFAYGQKVFKKLIGFEKVSAIAQQKGLPKEFTLAQNYPNPFNPSTTIQYALPRRSHVTLSVYNTLGQCISTLVDAMQEAGFYEVKFSGTGLSSGVYFYRIQAGNYVKTMKLIVLK